MNETRGEHPFVQGLREAAATHHDEPAKAFEAMYGALADE